MASSIATTATSLILGTLMSLLFILVGGLGKLVPAHPMYSTLKEEFDKLVGPYMGVPATPLRVLLGCAEVAAGSAVLVVIWGEEYRLFSDGKVAAIAHAIFFCALVGLITVMTGAGIFHARVEGRFAGIVYIGFVAMLAAVGAAHVVVGDFNTLPRSYKMLIKAFVALCILGFSLSHCWSYAFGISQAETFKRNAEVEQLKQQLLSSTA